MTSADLARIDQFASEDAQEPKTLRAGAMCLLSFHGLLRASEVAALDVDDVAFQADVIEIKVRQRDSLIL